MLVSIHSPCSQRHPAGRAPYVTPVRAVESREHKKDRESQLSACRLSARTTPWHIRPCTAAFLCNAQTRKAPSLLGHCLEIPKIPAVLGRNLAHECSASRCCLTSAFARLASAGFAAAQHSGNSTVLSVHVSTPSPTEDSVVVLTHHSSHISVSVALVAPMCPTAAPALLPASTADTSLERCRIPHSLGELLPAPSAQQHCEPRPPLPPGYRYGGEADRGCRGGWDVLLPHAPGLAVRGESRGVRG